MSFYFDLIYLGRIVQLEEIFCPLFTFKNWKCHRNNAHSTRCSATKCCQCVLVYPVNSHHSWINSKETRCDADFNHFAKFFVVLFESAENKCQTFAAFWHLCLVGAKNCIAAHFSQQEWMKEHSNAYTSNRISNFFSRSLRLDSKCLNGRSRRRSWLVWTSSTRGDQVDYNCSINWKSFLAFKLILIQ